MKNMNPINQEALTDVNVFSSEEKNLLTEDKTHKSKSFETGPKETF